jgi:uncharacterized protein (DUF885 family)
MHWPKQTKKKTRPAACGVPASLFVLLILSSCGGGSSAPTPPPVATPVIDDSQVEDLQEALAGLPFPEYLEESYRQLSLRDPEFVVRNGLSAEFELSEVSLTNVSEEYRLLTLDMMDAVLEILLRDFDYELLLDHEKVSFDTYRTYLEGETTGRDHVRFRYWAADGIYGEQVTTELFFTDQHPLETMNDADAYIERMALVPEKFDQIITNLSLSESNGIVEPAITTNIALNSVGYFLSLAPAQNPYYTSFVDKIEQIAELSDGDRSTLRSNALSAVSTHIIPAYQALARKLEALLSIAPADIGYRQYAGGPAYYDYMLKLLTTTDLTADEIHSLGLAEVARIHEDMRIAFADRGYPTNESLNESFGRLESDGGIVLSADVVDVNESIIAVARSLYGSVFSVQPQQEVSVIGGPGCCYYVPGAVDGSRPGAFHVGLYDTPYYQIPTTAYHEAIPGHHLQSSVARQTELPTFRNHIYSGAYIEGWGLYAEILAAELGWYDQDPVGNLGRLQAEVIRAVRLVVDTGIHSRGWGFDRAVDYFGENTGLPLRRSQGAAIRYSLIPGQATTYMIGSLKILELRDRAIDQLGSAFDLAEFHSVILEQGALPLTVLESVVDNYIADNLIEP